MNLYEFTDKIGDGVDAYWAYGAKGFLKLVNAGPAMILFCLLVLFPLWVLEALVITPFVLLNWITGGSDEK